MAQPIDDNNRPGLPPTNLSPATPTLLSPTVTAEPSVSPSHFGRFLVRRLHAKGELHNELIGVSLATFTHSPISH